MEQSRQVDVRADAATVWEVLTDVDRWSEWAPTVTSVQRLEEGPFDVGSRARIVQPRIPPTVYEVTELVPGRSFTWTASGPGVRTVARHVVEDLGPAGTRVTLTVAQLGPLGAVMGWFYRGLTEKYLAAEAEGLRARSESRT